MTLATATAPATARSASLPDSIRVEPLTCAIGAELSNVNLGVASRSPELVAEIRALLLKHKVLFFRDQDITRAEHVAFARHFGELEDHPVAGSDPDNPGLVRIYKTPDQPNDRYENAWHTDATWREKPPFGCVALRRVPARGRRHDGPTWRWPTSGCPNRSKSRSPTCALATASRPASARRCRWTSACAARAVPDAEHPVVRTHPETGEKILFVNAFTTHFTNFHTPDNVRVGQDYTHGGPQLLQYLISQALIPEFQVRLLAAQQHGDVGQPLHPALRGDGLPAVPPQDGTRRDRRRQAVLIRNSELNPTHLREDTR
jgi:taurine dioxygenase